MARSPETVESLKAEVDRLKETLARMQEVFAETLNYEGLNLTKHQRRILDLLVRRRRISNEQIYISLYGSLPDGGPDPQVLKVHIWKLRKKLAPIGVKIKTLWGQGYAIGKEDVDRLFIRVVSGNSATKVQQSLSAS